MEDWEKAADDPSLLVVQPVPINVNKWAGEDEDDVQDSWDLEEEKKDEEKVEIKMVKAKPKKSLAEKNCRKRASKTGRRRSEISTTRSRINT